MKCVKVTCPKCGSDNLREEELVPLTKPIARWYRDEGGALVHEVEEDEPGDAWWEFGEPCEKPYSCGGCFENLTFGDLVIGEEYDDGEDEEYDDDDEEEE